MTLEQRLDQLEQQTQRIERKNRRLTTALTMPEVAMCAVGPMAAAEVQEGDVVWAKEDDGDDEWPWWPAVVSGVTGQGISVEFFNEI